MPNNDYLELKEIYHHGIKGQKWGVRRFENEDGTLTKEGIERYRDDTKRKRNIANVALAAAAAGVYVLGRNTVKSAKAIMNDSNIKKEVREQIPGVTKKITNILGGALGGLAIGAVINNVRAHKKLKEANEAEKEINESIEADEAEKKRTMQEAYIKKYDVQTDSNGIRHGKINLNNANALESDGDTGISSNATTFEGMKMETDQDRKYLVDHLNMNGINTDNLVIITSKGKDWNQYFNSRPEYAYENEDLTIVILDGLKDEDLSKVRSNYHRSRWFEDVYWNHIND